MAAMRYLATLIVLSITLAFTQQGEALYSKSSPVVHLNEKSFRQNVLNGDGIWLVEFYAPWCGHCRNLVPEWEKSAKALSGIVNVAAVDATQDQNLASQYKIEGFPTIKIFGLDKNDPKDYRGARSAAAIVDAGLKAAEKAAKSRLSGGGRQQKSSGKKSKPASDKKSKSDVITLTEDNFHELVYNSKDLWLVEFYAPWCGHCKALAPEWEQAATQLKGDVKLGAVDATVHSSLAEQFNVRGYPTIKVLAPGARSSNDADDYNGARQADGIVSFALEKLETYGNAASIFQVSSQKEFDDACEHTKKSCIVVALPHILDSKKSGREAYISQLEDLAKKHRRDPFVFVWFEGGSQTKAEEALGFTFGFPAMAAINTNKKRVAILHGTFDNEGVESFLTGLTSGRVKPHPVKALPAFDTQKPWDGEEPVVEEEDSLADIMGDSWKDEL